MPSTTAAAVLMIVSCGSPIAARKPLMIPFFSSKTCQAIVRSKKFIHIGRINTKIMKPFLPSFVPLRIIPSGNASKRQRAVLINASSSESPSALACCPVAIATTFAQVNAPLRSVNP